MNIYGESAKIVGSCSMFRRFVLQRSEDVSGVSGTGQVAEGVEFSNGVCVVSWKGVHPSTVVYHQGIQDVIAVHGHEGRTVVEYLDDIEWFLKSA